MSSVIVSRPFYDLKFTLSNISYNPIVGQKIQRIYVRCVMIISRFFYTLRFQ